MKRAMKDSAAAVSANVGEKIKELRINKKISQEKLAFELGVSRQTIHKWEGNEMQPNRESIAMLSKYFGVNSCYFYVDGNVETEAAVADADCEIERKNRSKQFIVCLTLFIAFTILFLVFTVLSVASGMTEFTGVKGIVQVSTDSYELSSFVCFVVLSACSLGGAITALIFAIKAKCK